MTMKEPTVAVAASAPEPAIVRPEPGVARRPPPEARRSAPEFVFDAALTPEAFSRVLVSRLTYGISPASLIGAYTDWITHLAGSPGRQMELARKAWRKLGRLLLFASQSFSGSAPPSIEPLSQDRRFDHPGWKSWPFNVMSQAFLLNQQWWWNATRDVRGVTRHHEEVVTFVARQLLDVFSPSNFIATNPEILQMTAATGGINLLRGAMNAWEDGMRLLANLPPAGTEQYRVGENIAVTPGKVVYRNRLMELIQYAPATDKVYAEPVLIVPSWIMKYYILDLSPENSLVRYLVSQGHTVFTLSWKNPAAADRDLGMDSYLKEGVLEAIDVVSRIVPKERLHAVGYCLGGTILAIAAALLARSNDRQLKTMTLLASELDFTEPGELGLFIDESQIAYLEDIMQGQGFLDGKQMAGAFTLLNSKDLVWSRMVYEYLMGARRPMSDLMAWNADATRMPCRMHSEYLHRLYLHNELAAGNYRVDGAPVALSDIRVPIFAVSTERDHVSPWKSVYKIHLLTDTEITFLLTSGGHNVGVVNPPPGPKSSFRMRTHRPRDRYVDPDIWFQGCEPRPGSWWPQWQAWLAGHSGEQVAPPETGSVEKDLPVLDEAPGTYVFEP
jgi:polyhydroxyalkanoate synthase